jgi:prepilin-type N-terminal cleavage/methylation domain-containing protein
MTTSELNFDRPNAKTEAFDWASTKRTRSAFTLVELLVVVAVIGILVSMTLPAVQSVREAARNTQCLNKLRQVGLAVQNYESARMAIPPARAADGFMTWPVYLLPFLEQGNLVDRMDLLVRYRRQDPEILKIPLDLLVCPSRNRPDGLISLSESRDEPVGAVGDYAGNAGTTEYLVDDAWARFADPVNGVFNSGLSTENQVESDRLTKGPKGRYTFASITDGLSNTIFIGEKYVNQEHTNESGGWGDGAILNGDHPDTFLRLGGFALGIAKHSDLPLSPGEFPVFGSAHPSTANFTLGDASVHSVTKNLDEQTLSNLCSRNDGNVVSINE